MTPDPTAGGEVIPRKKRRPERLRAKQRPSLTVEQVLAWCDRHHERTGSWPIKTSGHVGGTTQETWCGVHLALLRGGRGLPGGTTLAQLLHERRDVRNLGALPPLSVGQILAWCDEHHERTGAWPLSDSGEIAGAPGETWRNVDAALAQGLRGLPGGDSLPRLLARERGVRNRKSLPPLSGDQILAWADAFLAVEGRWPRPDDGPIQGAPGETWGCVEAALWHGSRGLPGGATLPRLLQEHRGFRNRKRLPPLTEKMILAWARAHRDARGGWPNENSGPVPGTPGEVWANVNQSLRDGNRGLPGGDTLAKLLARRLGASNNTNVPPLSEKEVLAWADAYRERNGRWPNADSGPIDGSAGDTWQAVDDALRVGLRELAGGRSLARLLAEHRGARNKARPPVLTAEQILAWADEHQQRAGRWPVTTAGPIPGSGGDTWSGVDQALRRGRRGLPGGDSLSRLLARHGRAQEQPPAG